MPCRLTGGAPDGRWMIAVLPDCGPTRSRITSSAEPARPDCGLFRPVHRPGLTLKLPGALPAGPPPAAPSAARAGTLPAGAIIELDRTLDTDGVADLAKHRSD
jgi:hypothetical protein